VYAQYLQESFWPFYGHILCCSRDGIREKKLDIEGIFLVFVDVVTSKKKISFEVPASLHTLSF
jgi:hypothetical protein